MARVTHDMPLPPLRSRWAKLRFFPGRLLRSSVGADEEVLDSSPSERRSLTALSLVTLLSATLSTWALSEGLRAIAVGLSARLCIVAAFFAMLILTDRVTVSSIMTGVTTPRWRRFTVAVVNVILFIPISLLISELIMLRLFRQDVGDGGLLTQLATLSELVSTSAGATALLWIVRFLVFGILVLPTLATLATPTPVYRELDTLRRSLGLKTESERLRLAAKEKELRHSLKLADFEEVENAERAAYAERARERHAREQDHEVEEEVELRAAVSRLAEDLLARDRHGSIDSAESS